MRYASCIAAGQEPSSVAEDSATRIFYAEDDDDIRLLVEIILSKAGYVTDSYPDGTAARLALDDASAQLYLLDVRMPGYTGLQLCRHLRATRPARGNPVLIVSAERDQEDIAQALDAGADAFLSKPFSRRALLDRVEELLARTGNGHG